MSELIDSRAYEARIRKKRTTLFGSFNLRNEKKNLNSLICLIKLFFQIDYIVVEENIYPEGIFNK
jgi:hypothetical protein